MNHPKMLKWEDLFIEEIAPEIFYQKNIPSLKIWTNKKILDLISELSNYRLSFLIVWHDEKIVGWMPIFTSRKFIFEICANPYLFFYNQICYTFERKMRNQQNLFKELQINEIIGKYLNKSFFKININLDVPFFDMRGFIWSNLKCTPFYTQFMDLKKDFSEENYSISRRNGLKKAQKIEVVMDHCLSFEEFNHLMLSTYERKTYSIKSKIEYFYQFMNTLNQENLVDIFTYRYENKAVCFKAVLSDDSNKIAYSLFTGADQTAYRFGLNSLIYDTVMKYYKNQDYHTFDFCGMNIPSVSKFKSDFGGELKVYYKIHKNL